MFKQYKEAIESSNIVSKTDIDGILGVSRHLKKT